MNQNIVVFLFLVYFSSFSFADICPQIPPGSERMTEDDIMQEARVTVASPTTVTGSGEDIEGVSLGVGYLRVLGIDNHFYDWFAHIILPLWRAPEEMAFYGWLRNGNVIPENNPAYPLTGAGMVETEYEHNSFIVYEDTGDGWLRIRLKPGGEGDRWVHQCYLKLGQAGLKYEMWQSFLWEHSTWLHFRASVPHILRSAPDKASQQVTRIGLDHTLELLEFNGDWMRVRVEQPDNHCFGDAELVDRAIQHEGWVRWRDNLKGPWVWVYTRGC